MSKPPNKTLLGCVTLLSAYSSANLGQIRASEISVSPEGSSNNKASDVSATEQLDITEIASATVATNAQGIAPDSGVQPGFVAAPESGDEPTLLSERTTLNNNSSRLESLSASALQKLPADSALLTQESSVASVEGNNGTETTAAILTDSAESAQTLQQLSRGLDDRERLEDLVATAPTNITDNSDNTQAVALLDESMDSEPENSVDIAQVPIEPPVLTPSAQDQQVIEELLLEDSSSEAPRPYRASPAITISNPSGFGADNFTGFVGVGYQERTRFGNEDDGGIVVGLGLGDARENVGVQLSYTVASFGGSREFGTGGFNAKIHKRLADEWSVALGWEGFATTGFVDFEDSIYGSVSHLVRTRESINKPFSRIALTAGVGSGRFRTEDDVFDDRDTVGVFGSAAVRVAEPVSAIVEWTGQDLAVGLSIVPFKDLPIVLLPAVRDITGAGDGSRFVMGAGVSFEL
ncbi:MAG: hypothetical protein AAFR24_20785 [Cyanobacteria bacterium J06627_3]